MPTEVRAPLTGIVVRILAQKGSEVRAGDAVVVLESMKMEIAVESITDGTVSDVRKQEGDLVQTDEVLLVVDATGPGVEAMPSG